jgi:hypothetical protein
LGNRVGVVFHEDWQEFSPLLYSHYGANLLPIEIQNYLKKYKDDYSLDNHSGHLFNPCHMMVGFLQSIDKDIHIRVENLSNNQIVLLQTTNEYPNCFEGGCWIINISTKNFGQTICGDGYILVNENIVEDELESEYRY